MAPEMWSELEFEELWIQLEFGNFHLLYDIEVKSGKTVKNAFPIFFF